MYYYFKKKKIILLRKETFPTEGFDTAIIRLCLVFFFPSSGKEINGKENGLCTLKNILYETTSQ